MTTEPLKIVFCTSINFKKVTDVFVSSLTPLLLSNKVKLYGKIVDFSKFNNEFGFGTKSWRYAIIFKLKYALKIMRKVAGEEEYIVVCDNDIQFLNPIKLLDLVSEAKEKNLDFYGVYEQQSSTKKVFYNGGFYILKNSKKVRTFYENFLKRVKVSKNRLVDQEILTNMLLNEPNELEHKYIPKEYVALGCRGLNINNIFHHAIGRKLVSGKLKVMNKFKSEYDNLIKTTSHRLEL
jgi:hypothetical protein